MSIVEVSLIDKRWAGQIPRLKSFVKKILAACIDLEQYKEYQEYEISIVFADDKLIQELNKKYRNKDKPTNTLSFNYSNINGDINSNISKSFSNNSAANIVNILLPGVLIGEIILSFDTIEREAKELNYDFISYVGWMIIHSTLHILGYDHEANEDAELMEEKEDELLAILELAKAKP